MGETFINSSLLPSFAVFFSRPQDRLYLAIKGKFPLREPKYHAKQEEKYPYVISIQYCIIAWPEISKYENFKSFFHLVVY